MAEFLKWQKSPGARNPHDLAQWVLGLESTGTSPQPIIEITK